MLTAGAPYPPGSEELRWLQNSQALVGFIFLSLVVGLYSLWQATKGLRIRRASEEQYRHPADTMDDSFDIGTNYPEDTLEPDDAILGDDTDYGKRFGSDD